MNDDDKKREPLDGARVLTFDLSAFTDEQGKLSDEGREKLRAKMLSSLPPGSSEGDQSMLEAAIDEFLKDRKDGTFVLSCKSLVGLLALTHERLEGVPLAIRSLARLLNGDKPLTSAPHVFALGQAASLIAGAVSLVATAGELLGSVLSCEQGHGHPEPSGETEEKTTPHTPKGGLWS